MYRYFYIRGIHHGSCQLLVKVVLTPKCLTTTSSISRAMFGNHSYNIHPYVNSIKYNCKTTAIVYRRWQSSSSSSSSSSSESHTYHAILHALSKSTNTRRKGGESSSILLIQAEQLLAEMEQRYKKEDRPDLKPNIITYNTVLNAIAKSGEVDAPQRAERFLQTMLENYYYYLQTTTNIDKKDLDDGVIIKPDKISFTTVMDAWANSGDKRAPVRCEQILRKMEHLHHFWGDDDLQPDVHTFNTVIKAWAKSSVTSAASQAEKLLREMETRSSTAGEDHLKPNTITYDIVIDALAKKSIGDATAPQRAESILHSMLQRYLNGEVGIKPNTITFTSVIDAWANSSDKRGPAKAEQLLRTMDMLHNLGIHGMLPNVQTYTSVMNAWARQQQQQSSSEGSALSRAEQLLDEMERRAYETGDPELKPNTFTYNTLINALAKSGEIGAASRAERILTSMHKKYTEEGNKALKPTKWTYNNVINACALTRHEQDKKEALTIAFRLYDLMISMDELRPDAFSYTFLLKACDALITEEDRRLCVATSLFEECCKAGYVNNFVLTALRKAMPERHYIQLVGSTKCSTRGLPGQWTRKFFNNQGGLKLRKK
jgi:pentatricopeptide repeat protein